MSDVMRYFVDKARHYGNKAQDISCWLALIGVLLSAGCQRQGVSPGLELQSEDYSKARSHFQTHLLRQGPPPQQWSPLQIPAGAQQVTYSAKPLLAAWITSASDASQNNGQKRPAVLFLHGGFAMDGSDWEAAQPYRDAGYVVMMPVLRGENGQPGDYSMFYDEVTDVLAATEYLAACPYVDPKHLYIAGHSVGGTLTLLTAMTSTRFRAAASFSGSTDQIAWSSGQPEVVPFDSSDLHEFQMRSPAAFATSFKCLTRLYYGSQESLFGGGSQYTAALARKKNLDVEAVSVPGDHFSALSEEMHQSIQFFQTK